MLTRPRLLLALLGSAALLGCGPETRTNPFDASGLDLTVAGDLATHNDLKGADLAAVPDLTPPPDLAGAPDLAGSGDLAMPKDLAVTADMAVVADMAKASDLAVANDLTVANDLASANDLAAPADLSGPDLSIVSVDLAGADLTVAPDLASPPVIPSLLVTHVGDGVAALAGVGTPVTVRKFKFDGSELKVDNFPLAVPTVANGNNQPLTVSGSATSEGTITASSDGRYAVIVGYAAAVATAGVATSKSMTINRVIGRIDRLGNIDTSTRTDTAFDGGNIRSAATDDGTRFWAGGSLGGMQLLPFGKLDPGTQILAAPANERVVNVIGGQLYVTSGSLNVNTVNVVGMGLPTMAGQMATIGMGLVVASASPYGFALFDFDNNVAGVDNLYITDDRTAANGGGIQHWTFNGMTWTLVATLNGGLTNGMRGLAATVANKVVTLYATTSEASANSLVSIVDQGMAPMATVLATAPANTAFRSVCLAPTN